MECEICGTHMNEGQKSPKRHYHINILQDPKVRVFCSEACKLEWIFRITRKEAEDDTRS